MIRTNEVIKRQEERIMKANVILNCKSEQEAQKHASRLENYGYVQVANCYWTEVWQKPDGWTVQLNRTF